MGVYLAYLATLKPSYHASFVKWLAEKHPKDVKEWIQEWKLDPMIVEYVWDVDIHARPASIPRYLEVIAQHLESGEPSEQVRRMQSIAAKYTHQLHLLSHIHADLRYAAIFLFQLHSIPNDQVTRQKVWDLWAVSIRKEMALSPYLLPTLLTFSTPREIYVSVDGWKLRRFILTMLTSLKEEYLNIRNISGESMMRLWREIQRIWGKQLPGMDYQCQCGNSLGVFSRGAPRIECACVEKVTNELKWEHLITDFTMALENTASSPEEIIFGI